MVKKAAVGAAVVSLGEKDKLTSDKANRRTCELLSHARLVVYEEAGHFDPPGAHD